MILDNPNSLDEQRPSLFDGIESDGHAPCAAMAKKRSAASAAKKGGTETEQAERCIRLRKALGYPTSNAFANFLQIGNQRWNNFENGMPLSRDVVFLLVKSIPGLTSDWLYFGNPGGLTLELARLLGELGPPGNRTTV
jgi:hypothetical protein